MGDKLQESSVGSVHKQGPGFFSRTKLYLLDFVFALVILGMIAAFLSMSYYNLFGQLSQGFGLSEMGRGADAGAVWVMAALMVWLPFGLAFLLRARGQEMLEPKWRDHTARRVLVIMFRTLSILLATGFAFSAIYSILRLAIDPSAPITETIVGSALPGILSALTFGAMWFAFTGSDKPSRKVFSGVLVGVTVLTVLSLFTVTVINSRSSNFVDCGRGYGVRQSVDCHDRSDYRRY